ncbi:MAG: hypothetical protein CLLPBCKN_004179 [Chroococcidiopsis cubana SAG 39.79]|nr:hypothetical protein [Chroococcidiopsis cubana SAG 39.79]
MPELVLESVEVEFSQLADIPLILCLFAGMATYL